MKARPILFSGPMVRALLAGRKTQTRRIVKPQPDFLQVYEHKGRLIHDSSHRSWCWNGVAHGRYPDEYEPSLAAMCPYGQPGDLLIVRETVRGEEACNGTDGVRYLADDTWRPIENTREAADRWVELYGYRGKRGATVVAIHMPRWASRLTLEITGVRIERLQKISEPDALAEGCFWAGCEGDREFYRADYPPPGTRIHVFNPSGAPTAREAYRHLWGRINGDDSWAADPWVWVVEFKVHTANVDAIIKARAA